DIEINSIISVPLIGKGQMIGVIEAINQVDGEFCEEDLDILVGLANQIAVAIDNANLYRTMKQEALEKNLLFDIGKKLSGSLSLNEVLKEILEHLKQAVDFTAGGIFIINNDNKDVDSIYTVGYENCTEEKIHLKIGQGLVGHVAETGEPVIVPNVTTNEFYIDMYCNTKSEICVPIKIGDRIIGVFNLESDKLNAYDNNNLNLLNAFASQAGISIERARLHEELLAGQKINEQLQIARDIQQSFLPKKKLNLTGYDITGENIPSGQVGGDYFDFIRIIDNQIGIAIADGSGKGIPASLLMASFRASLIAEIRNNFAIRTICKKVNRLLFESIQSGNFVTAVYGVLDTKNHVFTFANCGHDQPILLRASGEVERLSEGGPILGVTSDSEYEERPIYIGVDDIIILFTDGVVEVFNDAEEEFGEHRIIAILKKHKDKTTTEIR
ncbi:MAG: SpoIIE family protein phosphatase, partial [Candidatus Heimdallarchaeota archaeon]|nr:SpoIIE family protein phosphatase [Candidatus Heimdallarchaeota archaeon]